MNDKGTAHTPGPWSVEDPMGDGPDDDLWIVVGEQTYDWRTVALVPCDLDKGSSEKPISRKQRNANARLIAIAPALLAGLEALQSQLDMLVKAIEADDPKAELLMRSGDMLRETLAMIALAKVTPE